MKKIDNLRYPTLVLTIYFFVTRLVLWRIRPMLIDMSNMHFLDQDVLRHHLLHGLYYMHAQPPLFNLFLGLVLKAAPNTSLRVAYTSVYTLIGLVLMLTAYHVMLALRVSRPIAFLTTAALMIFPSTIQAETWLYFSYPVSLLLMLIVFMLFRALHDKKAIYGMGFLFLMSVLVLFRSSYHLVAWMTPLVLLFLYLSGRTQGRKAASLLMVWAVIMAVFPAALYLRNYRRYGVFQSSTWIGFSAWSMTYFVNTDPPRLEALIRENKVTPLVRLGRFAPAEDYLAYYHEQGKTGIDIWDRLRVNDNAPNFNHFIYPRADAETYRNSMAIIRACPGAYWEAALNGVYIFFGFSPYRFFNVAKTFLVPDSLRTLVTVYFVPPLFLAMYLWVVLTLFKRLLSEWRRVDYDAARVGVFVFILFTILYMTLQTILLVFPEANYIRIPMDPLLFIGLAIAIDEHFRKAVTMAA